MRRLLFTLLTIEISLGMISCRLDSPHVLVLVKEGQAQCEIILREQASEIQKLAANDLQMYLQKMSGARVAATSSVQNSNDNLIYIGKGDHLAANGIDLTGLDLRRDGFIIKSQPGKIFITGETSWGTANGVYAFIEEHLGVKWYMPGEIGEVVPKAKTISIAGIDEVQKPDFLYRDLSPQTLHWSRRNRLGGLPLNYGGILVDYNRHPEYFALVNGARDEDGQLCYSNPNLATYASGMAASYFESHPQAVMFGLSPRDFYGWCECDNCRMLDPPQYRHNPWGGKAQRLLTFVNRVADNVARTHPGKFVSTYAYGPYYKYGGTIEPPTDVKARDNVIILPAHFEYCYAHPINDPRCQPNRKFNSQIEGWLKVARNLILIDYYAPSILPWPIFHVIRKNLPYLKKRGFLGLSNLGGLGWNAYLPNPAWYTATKLLWDTKTDTQKLWNDFFRDFYGPASKPMERYFATLEKAMAELDEPAPWDAPLKMYSPEVLKKCRNYLKEASSLATDDIVRKRISITRTHWEFTEMYVDLNHKIDLYEKTDRWEDLREIAEASAKILQSLEAPKDTVNAHWCKMFREVIGKDLEAYCQLRKTFSSSTRVETLWREDFSDSAEVFVKMDSYQDIEWMDGTSNPRAHGYITSSGKNSYAQWKIAHDRPFSKTVLFLQGFDFYEKIGYFILSLSTDAGESWQEVAVVDNNRWCVQMVDISPLVKGKKEFLFRGSFPPNSGLNCMLADLRIIGETEAK